MVILFVCTGNTCRSSMAGALARRELERAGIDGFEVKSAGTGALPGLPASAGAIAAMEEMEIDIKDHRSTALDKNIIKEADIIFTMTESQRRVVLDICAGVAGRVYTLPEFAGVPGDVRDPFGGDAEVYRRTADCLESLVVLAVRRVMREKD